MAQELPRRNVQKSAIAAVLAFIPLYWWGGATAKPDGVVAGDTARAKPRAIETISRLLIPPPRQPHRHDTRAAQQHPAQHIQRKMRPQKHPSQRVYADKTPDPQPAQHAGTRREV